MSCFTTPASWQPQNGSARIGLFRDPGRAAVTGRETDRGAFKTPTLRDVARTAPYMHDGSLATIEDVIEFYDGGGRPNPYIESGLRPLRLPPDDKQALAAFLRSLTGTIQEGPRPR
jgi:cytochrome c peroxidase